MTSEEQLTAWIDGELTAAERVEFEKSLPPDAVAERDAWLAFRTDLREAVPKAQLSHQDFLASRVMDAVRADQSHATQSRGPRLGMFGFPRFGWFGIALLAVAALVTALLYPERGGAPTEQEFMTQILDAEAVKQGTTAFAFSAHGNSAAVLWIENAGYIPPDQRIK